MPMFFVQFEATPQLDNPDSRNSAGAFVNCWIARDTIEEAIRVGREWIAGEGWIVNEPDEAYVVDESWYRPGAKGREYFEQALIDREVFVFYCFPDQEEADDED